MKDFLVKSYLYRGTSMEWLVDRKLICNDDLSGCNIYRLWSHDQRRDRNAIIIIIIIINNKRKRWWQHEPSDPHMAAFETPSQRPWTQPVQVDAASEQLREHLWWGRTD